MESQIYYLNNAATTFPKPIQVQQSIVNAVTNLPNENSRSCNCTKDQNDLSILCRNSLLNLFNLSKEYYEPIITPGATYSLNLFIQSITSNVSTILTTSLEHNSVYRPINANSNCKYCLCKMNPDLTINLNDLEDQLKNNKYINVIIINHMSNVIGVVQPLDKIIDLVKKYHKVLLVDITQSAGSVPIDLSGLDYQNVYFAGAAHKNLFGPSGIGYLIRHKKESLLKPLIFGGTGTNSFLSTQPTTYPEYLESGTPNYIGMAGMMAGISYIENQTIDMIQTHKKSLIDICISKLYPDLVKKGFIEVIGPVNKMSGIFTFNLTGRCEVDNSSFAKYLNSKYRIVIREGQHCAPMFHKYIQRTTSIRLSVSIFNTSDEIEYFCDVLKFELLRK